MLLTMIKANKRLPLRVRYNEEQIQEIHEELIHSICLRLKRAVKDHNVTEYTMVYLIRDEVNDCMNKYFGFVPLFSTLKAYSFLSKHFTPIKKEPIPMRVVDIK